MEGYEIVISIKLVTQWVRTQRITLTNKWSNIQSFTSPGSENKVANYFIVNFDVILI